jgi:hypothetical protein
MDDDYDPKKDRGLIVEYAKTGRSSCNDKNCSFRAADGTALIEKGCVRIGSQYPSPFDPEKLAVAWYHAACRIRNVQQRGRKNRRTIIIRSVDQLAGYDDLEPKDQNALRTLIEQNQIDDDVGEATPPPKRTALDPVDSTTVEDSMDKAAEEETSQRLYDAEFMRARTMSKIQLLRRVSSIESMLNKQAVDKLKLFVRVLKDSGFHDIMLTAQEALGRLEKKVGTKGRKASQPPQKDKKVDESAAGGAAAGGNAARPGAASGDARTAEKIAPAPKKAAVRLKGARIGQGKLYLEDYSVDEKLLPIFDYTKRPIQPIWPPYYEYTPPGEAQGAPKVNAANNTRR